MQLDELTATIRPRTSWEGLDLGFALARHWFPILCSLWCLTALPLALVSALWLPERPDLWILLVWWCKPLYEAPILFWLSRALFGQSLGLRDLWRHRREALPLRLLPNLLWRRFHLSRSFQLPLLLLEGTTGPARRQRQRVLQGGDGAAGWLTVICLHLEYVLWGSALLLAAFLVPAEIPSLDLEAAVLDDSSGAYWISSALYLLAMAVMAPFYVAAGFAYYLTRRTELEAWDLELAFRRARPPEETERRRPPAAAATAALLVLALLLSDPAAAQVESPSPAEARSLIAEILGQEDFGTKKAISVWTFVGDEAWEDEEAELPAWLDDLLKALAEGAGPTAGALKWALILVAATLGVLALRRILLDLRHWRITHRQASKAPPEPLRLDRTDPSPLPADIAGTVQDLLARGELRGALALLYRASLTHLQQQGLKIPDSATESECLDLISRFRPPAERDLLRRLSRSWQRLAYGHRAPERAQIGTLLRDWQAWQEAAE